MSARTGGVLEKLFLDTPVLRKLGRNLFPRYQVRTEDGTIFHLRSRGGDLSVLNEIHAFGMYEACIGVEHGDFVIDVGAHIGSFTIDSAKKAGPSGLVVALEPSSENFQLLSENVSCNSLSNVRLMNLAAGAEEGAANLNIYEPVANSLHMRDRKRTGTERVAVRTLDSLVKELALERVDYLKINVEGHELEVLNGAPTILTDFHPSLILEMHNFGPSESQLRTLLSQFYDKLEKKGSLLFSSRLPRSMN